MKYLSHWMQWQRTKGLYARIMPSAFGSEVLGEHTVGIDQAEARILGNGDSAWIF
jgi:hypothetical protein